MTAAHMTCCQDRPQLFPKSRGFLCNTHSAISPHCRKVSCDIFLRQPWRMRNIFYDNQQGGREFREKNGNGIWLGLWLPPLYGFEYCERRFSQRFVSAGKPRRDQNVEQVCYLSNFIDYYPSSSAPNVLAAPALAIFKIVVNCPRLGSMRCKLHSFSQTSLKSYERRR